MAWLTLPLLMTNEAFTFLAVYLYFLMLFRRRSLAPALAIASNHTVSQDIEDWIVFDRTHEICRFHDFLSGI